MVTYDATISYSGDSMYIGELRTSMERFRNKVQVLVVCLWIRLTETSKLLAQEFLVRLFTF